MKKGEFTKDPETFTHNVLFCENDVLLLDALGHFIGGGLESGCATVVIATPSHRATLEEWLKRRGLDMDASRQAGQYIAADAADTLARFMVNGWPDEQRFAETVEGLFAAMKGQYPRVRAYGEMVALLCADKKPEAAVQLEKLWNAFGRRHAFSLLCAYSWDVVKRDVNAMQVHRICDEHRQVIPQQPADALTKSEDPRRAIVESYETTMAQVPQR